MHSIIIIYISGGLELFRSSCPFIPEVAELICFENKQYRVMQREFKYKIKEESFFSSLLKEELIIEIKLSYLGEP